MLGGQSDFGSMQFHTFEKTAKNMLLNVDYKESRQKRRKRQDNDGHAADAQKT